MPIQTEFTEIARLHAKRPQESGFHEPPIVKSAVTNRSTCFVPKEPSKSTDKPTLPDLVHVGGHRKPTETDAITTSSTSRLFQSSAGNPMSSEPKLLS
jgi:hypothetical protein